MNKDLYQTLDHNWGFVQQSQNTRNEWRVRQRLAKSNRGNHQRIRVCLWGTNWCQIRTPNRVWIKNTQRRHNTKLIFFYFQQSLYKRLLTLIVGYIKVRSSYNQKKYSAHLPRVCPLWTITNIYCFRPRKPEKVQSISNLIVWGSRAVMVYFA